MSMSLVHTHDGLVRVLPSTQTRMGGRRNWDYRLICDCQRHTRRRRAADLARVAFGHIQKRAVALVIAIPLAFCALGFPMDAMNVISLPLMASHSQERPQFHIFTSAKSREAILRPDAAPKGFSLDLAKEEFFSSQVPYGSIIYREAVRNNLAPELVAAVVEAESDFRPKLVSNKNAQGLMQLIPETGKLLGCDNPFNPEANVAAGTRYLRYLMDRYAGDQRLALAAYNAGEGTIERFGGVPPFPETINYLQRVTSGTRTYKQRVQNRYLAALRIQAALLE
jgi:transglycosylase-like protein with SLT domain